MILLSFFSVSELTMFLPNLVDCPPRWTTKLFCNLPQGQLTGFKFWDFWIFYSDFNQVIQFIELSNYSDDLDVQIWSVSLDTQIVYSWFPQTLFSIKDVSQDNYCLIVLLFISETIKCVLHQSHSFVTAEVAAKAQRSLQGSQLVHANS